MNVVVRTLLLELKQPIHYVVAAGVGLLFTYLGTSGISSPIVPFLVPFTVSFTGRYVTRLRSRKEAYLLELPALRESPVFVMGADGTIVAASGRTEALFRNLGVTNVCEFFTNCHSPGALELILARDSESGNQALYAPSQQKWYTATKHFVADRGQHLVWLDDVTVERKAAEQGALLRGFQNDLFSRFRDGNLVMDADARLAELVLDGGYAAVLFARGTNGGGVSGYAYRRNSNGALIRSGLLNIDADTHAPVFESRRTGRAVYAERSAFSDVNEFDRMYPVARDVRMFLDEPVANLVNYHAGITSIVAFNKPESISGSDLLFIESAVDAAHGMFAMVEAARDLDTRFIQSIHGLCASAEFSDEITGSHIWRVNLYARELAEQLSTDVTFCRDISQVAATHDIGKVAMPELIRSPGIFSPEERQLMHMHTVYGAQILDRMIEVGDQSDPRLCMARDIALHHHQRWDGNGYPGLKDRNRDTTRLESRDPAYYAGLKPFAGDEIPLSARIVSACDSYDALRSERPYKKGFSHQQTMEIMSRDDRTGATGEDRFGPDVFEAFLETAPTLQRIFDDVDQA